MNNSSVNNKGFNVLKLILAINFNASVIFLLIVGVISAMGSTLFFDDQNELYGPMAGNLRLMLIYLCLTELAVYSFCRFGDNYQGLLILGAFLLILMVSIEFYGTINQVPIDDNYPRFFLYLGLSHIGYGALPSANKA
ncbi:MAG: hypothetical protein LUQ11_08295 [Methylococcaceae bacterium]|nr:hypothetical protein [Methylococcaceae bacterium]